MVFYNATTEDAIVQEVWRICGATVNTYPLKEVTARVNQGLDRFVAIALMNDGMWEFDDPNKTDLPIATTNLISGQYDYSFASELLTVTKVLVMDSAGNWSELPQVDQYDKASMNVFVQPSGNSGIPNKYDILGNSLLLDPIPNYSQTAGLKVVFKRNAVKFVSTDTTAQPGIPSIFHPYLCRFAALPFLISKRLPNKNDVAAQIVADEQAIIDFMSDRDKTTATIVKTAYRSPR